MSQLGIFNVVDLSVLILLSLTVVPVLNGTVVAGDTGVDLGLLAALGAGELLACDIAVGSADRVGGRHGVVGKLVVFGDLSDEGRGSLPVGKLFAEECVENGTRGIEGLKLILNV